MHLNFVFAEGSTVYLGQAAHCSGTGGQTETDGCTSGSLPLGTPVEVTGAEQDRHPRLQLLADHAGGRRERSRHLRLQRPRPDQARPHRRRQGKPLRSRLRRPDRRRHRRRPRLHRLLLRQLRAARWDHQAEPEAGHRGPERRRRLEPHRRHRHPGRPRRLGQRLHERSRQGDRHPLDAAAGAPGGHQRGRRPRQGARLRPRPRLPELHLVPGTQPFSASLVGAILGA